MIIYTDMVADLYHYGHLKYLENIDEKLIKNTNNELYVGIHNDIAVESYKRKPVLNMYQRSEVLKSNKYINKLILDAQLIPSEEYIKKHDISVLCIPNNRTKEINEWYKNIINKGIKIEKF